MKALLKNKIVVIGWLLLTGWLFALAPGSILAADAGSRLYKKGDYSGALRHYDRVLKDHPDWEEAHFGKGAALYKSNRIEEALQEFERSLSIKDPLKKSAVFYNLGNSLFQSGRVGESLQFYKKALELNPRDFDAKHNYELARLALQQQQSQNNKQSQNKQSQEKQSQQQTAQNQSQQRNRQEQQKKQEEAAQVLDALKNNEKKLMQERLRDRHPSLAKEKDW